MLSDLFSCFLVYCSVVMWCIQFQISLSKTLKTRHCCFDLLESLTYCVFDESTKPAAAPCSLKFLLKSPRCFILIIPAQLTGNCSSGTPKRKDRQPKVPAPVCSTLEPSGKNGGNAGQQLQTVWVWERKRCCCHDMRRIGLRTQRELHCFSYVY